MMIALTFQKNYLNNKSLRDVLGKNAGVLKHFCKNDLLMEVKSEVKGIIIMISHKSVRKLHPQNQQLFSSF